MSKIKHIVIVGGGTSGWMSAAYLAKKVTLASKGAIKITLIESSDIGTIGVGEATIPNILKTISELGIDEKYFMKSCSATFKQAIKFVDWYKAPKNGVHSHYYHPFSESLKAGPDEYAPYWILNRDKIKDDYVHASTVHGLICDHNLAPKGFGDPDFRGPIGYAYHFDAGLVAKLLKSEGKKNGVNHLIGNVTGATLDERGNINSLQTKEHGDIEGDLFIDCTGFAAHLIEKKLQSEFKDVTNILFNDSAVAAMIPYKDPNQEISSSTISTAQECGWTWDIGLSNRRGTGYVYSSKYTDKDRAEEVFREKLGCSDDASVQHIKIRVGYRPQQWFKNCVAIGLSGGFVEPLESTGIYLVEIALRTLTNLFPYQGDFETAAKQYNKLMVSQYTGIIDFIKLHYVLSKRDDTDFWLDNVKPETCPDSLLDFLDRCKYRVPNIFDLPLGPQCFTIYSYYAILYGMNHYPDLSASKMNLQFWPEANNIPPTVKSVWGKAQKSLPSHREYIKMINKV